MALGRIREGLGKYERLAKKLNFSEEQKTQIFLHPYDADQDPKKIFFYI